MKSPESCHGPQFLLYWYDGCARVRKPGSCTCYMSAGSRKRAAGGGGEVQRGSRPCSSHSQRDDLLRFMAWGASSSSDRAELLARHRGLEAVEALSTGLGTLQNLEELELNLSVNAVGPGPQFLWSWCACVFGLKAAAAQQYDCKRRTGPKRRCASQTGGRGCRASKQAAPPSTPSLPRFSSYSLALGIGGAFHEGLLFALRCTCL